ncbi:MAG: SET domain-containing protein [Verrucomicrobiales bacterium]|nr:SET domain-containing protein [Verrucomicrobiales bacterium]
MMLIRTVVRPSSIHGMGLFAVERIPRGTEVWRYESGFDRSIPGEAVNALPSLARDHVHWFAYQSREDGQWILSGDHTCFMNHSDSPNTGTLPGSRPPITTVALREIAAGEELTCDYRAFDAQAMAKLGR